MKLEEEVLKLKNEIEKDLREMINAHINVNKNAGPQVIINAVVNALAHISAGFIAHIDSVCVDSMLEPGKAGFISHFNELYLDHKNVSTQKAELFKNHLMNAVAEGLESTNSPAELKEFLDKKLTNLKSVFEVN